MKKVKTIAALALTAAMALSFTACGSSSDTSSNDTAGGSAVTEGSASSEGSSTDLSSAKIDEIKARGSLVMGTASGYPPFEFVSVDNDGAVIGIDVELGQAIADKLGVDLVVKDMAFSELVTTLTTDGVDICIAGMPETEEKAEVVDFSDIYIDDVQGIVVRAEDKDKYTSLADFEGATVDVEMGASSATVAEEEMTGANVNALSLIADCFAELENGKCDAVVTGSVIAKQYMMANDGLVTLDDISFTNSSKACQACIAKSDDTFMQLINDTIKELQDDGSFDKWIDEYSEQSYQEASK